jgi:hypothetical protein
MPRRLSNLPTLLDTADGVVSSKRAAPVKEPASTARIKADKPFRFSTDISDLSAKLIAPLENWAVVSPIAKLAFNAASRVEQRRFK